MAAGAGFYNAQGVWQYGETDNIGTLFSDFMNVAPVSITTQFVADRSRITTLESTANNPTVYVAASAAARNAHWGTPTTSSTQLALQNLGATTIRTDTGVVERYFATYNATTNIGGSAAPGWYPVDGSATFSATATKSTTNNTVENVGASGYAYTELTDNLGWHSPTVNPERITPTVAGLYRVTSTIYWGAGTTGTRRLQLLKNATPILESRNTASVSIGNNIVFVLAMNGTTDYININSFQDNGGALTSSVAITVEYVRPTIV
jgi:hypothetical protein